MKISLSTSSCGLSKMSFSPGWWSAEASAAASHAAADPAWCRNSFTAAILMAMTQVSTQ